MTKLRKRTEEIRKFIVANVAYHPKDIANVTAKKFDISRQAVNKHIQILVEQKALQLSGTTQSRHYSLQSLERWENSYALNKALEEHVVWQNDIEPRLGQMSENVMDIWQYGFTEMLNNAIDHSSGTKVDIQLIRTAANCEIIIRDNGEGIFKKIQRILNLTDERQALLELAKGKLTTDPDNHSGEGIFFSSRLFDSFWILSGNVFFDHRQEQEVDWIDENEFPITGTTVSMQLNNNSHRNIKQVFDSFTDEDYSFARTVVPVRLAQYGHEKLISRSQAKRLLARIERFKVVMFDFEGVEMIGQAFADEIFRVFSKQHPDVKLSYVKTCQEVEQMISRAGFKN
ncbi:STAS-like domain-containing protein [Methylobacter sp.]|uniref:STAS-like domain-containing protein n=1 Tax=Methylobacter sp. TaxID=2051955 RepID=UPI002FDD23A5